MATRARPRPADRGQPRRRAAHPRDARGGAGDAASASRAPTAWRRGSRGCGSGRPTWCCSTCRSPTAVGLETLRALFAPGAGAAGADRAAIVADQELAVEAVSGGAGLPRQGARRLGRAWCARSATRASGGGPRRSCARRTRRWRRGCASGPPSWPGPTPSCASRSPIAARPRRPCAPASGCLQGIVDNAAAVIYIKDTEGRYLLVNRAFEELFRDPPRRRPRQDRRGDFPREQAEAARANDCRVLEANGPLQWEEVACRRRTANTPTWP